MRPYHPQSGQQRRPAVGKSRLPTWPAARQSPPSSDSRVLAAVPATLVVKIRSRHSKTPIGGDRAGVGGRIDFISLGRRFITVTKRKKSSPVAPEQASHFWLWIASTRIIRKPSRSIGLSLIPRLWLCCKGAKGMLVSEFDFNLPDDLIAQHPVEPRNLRTIDGTRPAAGLLGTPNVRRAS